MNNECLAHAYEHAKASPAASRVVESWRISAIDMRGAA